MLTVPTERLEGAIEPSHSPRWEIVVVPSGVGTRAGTHEQRPRVAGKFLFVGSEKLYVRGVTYGAFRPDEKGNEYHDLGQIEATSLGWRPSESTPSGSPTRRRHARCSTPRYATACGSWRGFRPSSTWASSSTGRAPRTSRR